MRLYRSAKLSESEGNDGLTKFSRYRLLHRRVPATANDTIVKTSAGALDVAEQQPQHFVIMQILRDVTCDMHMYYLFIYLIRQMAANSKIHNQHKAQ